MIRGARPVSPLAVTLLALAAVYGGHWLQRWGNDCTPPAAIGALIIASAVLSLLSGLWHHCFARSDAEETNPGEARISKSALAGALGIAALLLLVNLQAPAAGWDALGYHLNYPLQWAESGRCAPTLTGFGDYSPDYYPMLVSQVAYLLVLVQPALGELSGALWYVLQALALWQIMARMLPGAEFHAIRILLFLACISLPYTAIALLGTENDSAVAALCLAAIALLLPGPGERVVPTTQLALAGLAIGLAASVKFLALIYGAALLALALIQTGGELRRCLFLILPAVLAGAAQYVQNFLQTGNPLYPAELRLGGAILFAGFYPEEFFEAVAHHPFSLYGLLTDPGAAGALLAAVAGVLAWIKQPSPTRRSLFILAAAGPLLLFVFVYLSPLRPHRLAAAALAISIPAAALLLQTRLIVARLVLAAVVGLHLLLIGARIVQLHGSPWVEFVTMNDYDRATALTLLRQPAAVVAVVAILVGIIFGLRLLLTLRKRWLLAFAALLVLLLALPASLRRKQVSYRAEDLGHAWEFARRAPARATGVIGVNAVAPFRNDQNESPTILLLNREGGDVALHLRQERLRRGDDGWRLEGADAHPEAFARNIAALRRLVLVGSRNTPLSAPQWPAEREWLLEKKEWKRVAAWPTVEIYERYGS